VQPAGGAAPLLRGAAESAWRTEAIVDQEVRRIILEDARKKVVALLTEKRPQKLAQALLENETLDVDDGYAAARVEHEPSDITRDFGVAANVTTP
jgi:ATP-dependent Zn protease